MVRSRWSRGGHQDCRRDPSDGSWGPTVVINAPVPQGTGRGCHHASLSDDEDLVTPS